MSDIIDLTNDSDNDSDDSDARSAGLISSSSSERIKFGGNRERYECGSVMDVRSVNLMWHSASTWSCYLGFVAHLSGIKMQTW